MFNLSRDIGRPRIKGSRDFSEEPLNLSDYSAMFGAHSHCGTGDISLARDLVRLRDQRVI